MTDISKGALVRDGDESPDEGESSEAVRTASSAQSPWWAWLSVAGAIAVWLFWKGELSRFPEWDESVFYSQSGGFNGNDAPPATMVATRESAPSVFLGFFRAVGLDVQGTRIAVFITTTLVMLLASARLERHFGRWVGPLSALLLGTSWLYAAYATSFFSAAPASVLALLIFSLYLDLRVTDRAVHVGLLLGFVTAIALWFRPFETGTVLIPLALHSAIVRPSALWVERRNGIAAAFGSIAILFVVPWSIDSVNRYGGVTQRFSSASGQGYTLGPGIRIGSYLDRFAGDQNDSSPYTQMPTWVYQPLQLIVIAVIAVGIVSIALTWKSERHHGLIAVLALSSTAFYLFISAIITDRYLVHGLVFWCLGAAILIVAALQSQYRLIAAALLTPVAAVWFAAQIAVVGPYIEAEEINSRKVELVGVALDPLLGDDCRGVARYGAPMWQLSSTCSFIRSSSIDDAKQKALALADSSGTAMLIWPAEQYVASPEFESWTLVEFSIVRDAKLVILISGPEIDDATVAELEELSRFRS